MDQVGNIRLNNDGKPHYMLGYTNGPGWKYHRSSTNSFDDEIFRKDISDDIDSGHACKIPFNNPH